jgi:hypothetical protein
VLGPGVPAAARGGARGPHTDADRAVGARTCSPPRWGSTPTSRTSSG